MIPADNLVLLEDVEEAAPQWDLGCSLKEAVGVAIQQAKVVWEGKERGAVEVEVAEEEQAPVGPRVQGLEAPRPARLLATVRNAGPPVVGLLHSVRQLHHPLHLPQAQRMKYSLLCLKMITPCGQFLGESRLSR
jgi:hypothetical protein